MIVQLWVVGFSEHGGHIGIATTVVDVTRRGRHVASTVWDVDVVRVNVGGAAAVKVLLVVRGWNCGGLRAPTGD